MTITAPAPIPFTRELVEAGVNKAHTYDSWARAVIAEAFERAASAESFDSNGMSVTGDITIRPGSTVGRDPSTNSVCIDVAFLGIHIHVEWE